MGLDSPLVPGTVPSGSPRRSWALSVAAGLVGGVLLGAGAVIGFAGHPGASAPASAAVQFESSMSKLAVVQGFFKDWEGGKFFGPGALETSKKWWTADSFVDVSGIGSPTWKVYHGPAGAVEFLACHEARNFAFSNLSFAMGMVGDEVGLIAKAVFTCKSTGKSIPFDVMESYGVRGDKLTYCKRYYKNWTLLEILGDCPDSPDLAGPWGPCTCCK